MSTQTHFLPRPLEYGTGTVAHWACKSAKRLIVFVHGFGGSACGTWPDFPALLPQTQVLANTDLIFYGYDGRFTQANSSAVSFFDFLDEFLKNPASSVNRTQPLTAPDRADFKYNRVTIVAHSLGAVVARRALLHGHKLQATGLPIAWLGVIRMLFFAPAHAGAYAAGVAQSFLTSQSWWLGKIAAHAALYKSPLISDLVPESPTIKELERDTDDALKSLPPLQRKEHLVAARVIWAENDRVVRNATFCSDPPPKQFPRKDHMQVCKPRSLADPILNEVLSHA